MLHGIRYKLEEWIKRYLIQTYHRLSQEYFKSYRIAFKVALRLDFEQLSSYLFISRCLFQAAISKCYMEFDTKFEDWIKRYLIQTYHRLSQEYFKSYRIAFRVALWHNFEQLSSYLFVYLHFLDLRYDNVTWNLIQIGGVNQKISYSNLPQVISRVFQVIYNSFDGGFMAWFWTIIQLLIHFTVSF